MWESVKKGPSLERLILARTPYQRPGGLYVGRPARNGASDSGAPRQNQGRGGQNWVGVTVAGWLRRSLDLLRHGADISLTTNGIRLTSRGAA
jgi:hypothetical protein